MRQSKRVGRKQSHGKDRGGMNGSNREPHFVLGVPPPQLVSLVPAISGAVSVAPTTTAAPTTQTPEVKRERPAPPPPRPPVRAAPPPAPVAQKPTDGGDVNEAFGWARIDTSHIPVIYRSGIEYVVVKMVELKLLWRYPNNYPELLQRRPALRSTFMFASEATVINEINEMHCSYEYGTYKFQHKDLLVKRKEFEDFYSAVKECFPEITNNQAVKVSEEEIRQMSGGWIQINNTVCPFVKRKESKFVPLSVIQYSANLLKDNYIEGWLPSPKECAYFNDCCTRVGLRFSFGRDCLLVCIDLVKKLCNPQKCEDLPRERPFEHVKPIPHLYTPFVRGVSTVALTDSTCKDIGAPVNLVVCQNGEIIDQENPQFHPGGALQSGQARKPTIPQPQALPVASKRSTPQLPISVQPRSQQPAPNVSVGPPPAKRSANGPRIAAKTELSSTQYGSCYSLSVQISSALIKFSVIQPSTLVMYNAGVRNYTPSPHVMIEQVKSMLFPNWNYPEFIEKIRLTEIARNVTFILAPQTVQQMFTEVFKYKFLHPDMCYLLAVERFLEVLPYLQIKYSETLSRPSSFSIQPKSAPTQQRAAPPRAHTGQTMTDPVIID